MPTFRTPFVLHGTAVLTFELTVMDGEGLSDTDRVDVAVRRLLQR
jgi:hypothetical protein